MLVPGVKVGKYRGREAKDCNLVNMDGNNAGFKIQNNINMGFANLLRGKQMHFTCLLNVNNTHSELW